jgi:hypothetical protein
MKPFGLAVVLSFFTISILNSQVLNEKFEDKIYLKAGYVYTYQSGIGHISKKVGGGRKIGATMDPKGWYQTFNAGLGYEFSERLYFDITYQFTGNMSFSETERWGNGPNSTLLSNISTSYDIYDLTLRGNYFVNVDRRDDPIYYSFGLSFSVQPVNNKFIEEYEDRTVTTNESYTRFSAGPVAGVGIYWETGPVTFMTEVMIGSRVSIWKKEMVETSITLNFSPVIRLKNF